MNRHDIPLMAERLRGTGRSQTGQKDVDEIILLHVSVESRQLDDASMALLEVEPIPDGMPWLTQAKAAREKPPAVTGGTYSVRRRGPRAGPQ